MCGTFSVVPSRWMAAHTVARSRESSEGAGGLEVGCEGDDGSEIAGAKGACGLEIGCGGDVGSEKHL